MVGVGGVGAGSSVAAAQSVSAKKAPDYQEINRLVNELAGISDRHPAVANIRDPKTRAEKLSQMITSRVQRLSSLARLNPDNAVEVASSLGWSLTHLRPKSSYSEEEFSLTTFNLLSQLGVLQEVYSLNWGKSTMDKVKANVLWTFKTMHDLDYGRMKLNENGKLVKVANPPDNPPRYYPVPVEVEINNTLVRWGQPTYEKGLVD